MKKKMFYRVFAFFLTVALAFGTFAVPASIVTAVGAFPGYSFETNVSFPEGGSGYNRVVPDSDGGYIAINSKEDFFTKFDADNNIVWSKKDPAFLPPAGNSGKVVAAADGGYYKMEMGITTQLLTKYAADDSVIWSILTPFLISMVPTPDGGVIGIASGGGAVLGFPGGYVVKYDADGNRVWDDRYSAGSNFADIAYLPSGDCVIAGADGLVVRVHDSDDVDIATGKYINGHRYLVVLNSDSSLIHLVDLDHPAGQYAFPVYDANGTEIFPAGTDYPEGFWLTDIGGVHLSQTYSQPADGDPAKANFHSPQGVIATSDGRNIYIADTLNNCIRRIYVDSSDNWKVELLAGQPGSAGGYAGDGGLALAASLNNPVGIVLDAAEKNLYIADSNNHCIRKIDLTTKIITTVAGNGIAESRSGKNDGVYTAGLLSKTPLFRYPYDVALDDMGNIYVADAGNNRIRKINSGLTEISTIFGDGYARGGDTSINQPKGIEVDRNTGIVYASDTAGNRILKLMPDKDFLNYTMTVYAGTGTGGLAPGVIGPGGQYKTPVIDAPVATEAQVWHPRGLTLDDEGNLYFADERNGAVRVVTKDGRLITITGNGVEAGSAKPPNGVYPPGWEMYEPMDVCFFKPRVKPTPTPIATPTPTPTATPTPTPTATPTPEPTPNATAKIEVEKVVSGKNAPIGATFIFKLTQVKNAAGEAYDGPGDPITDTVIVTTDIFGPSDYNFSFDLDNLADGIYYFKIEETNGAAAGWSYDSVSYIVRLTVVDAVASVETVSVDGFPQMVDSHVQEFDFDPEVTYTYQDRSLNYVLSGGGKTYSFACGDCYIPGPEDYIGTRVSYNFGDAFPYSRERKDFGSALAFSLMHIGYGAGVTDAEFNDVFGFTGANQLTNLGNPRRENLMYFIMLFYEFRDKYPSPSDEKSWSLTDGTQWPTVLPQMPGIAATYYMPLYNMITGGWDGFDYSAHFFEALDIIEKMMAVYNVTPEGESISTLWMNYDADSRLTFGYDGYQPPDSDTQPVLSWTISGGGTVQVIKNGIGSSITSGTPVDITAYYEVIYDGDGSVTFTLEDNRNYLIGGSVEGYLLQPDKFTNDRPGSEDYGKCYQRMLIGSAKFVTLKNTLSIPGDIIFYNKYNNIFMSPALVPSKSYEEFDDLESGAWYEESVKFVLEKGLFLGVSENEFSPNANITRGMFVVVLSRFDDADLSEYTGSRFDDIAVGEWYTRAVEWAAENGIVNGKGGNNFEPNIPVTREEKAVLIHRYLREYKKYGLREVDPPITFDDESSISEWAKEAVAAMQKAGIFKGKSDNKFDPKNTATRAEASTVFKRLYDYVYD